MELLWQRSYDFSPLKTKAEYEPDDIAAGVATKAVDAAQ